MNRKKKKRAATSRKPAASTLAPAPRVASSSLGWVKKPAAFLASSGLLVALLATGYQYCTNDVSLEFLQAVGNAYEFQLKNDTPSDRTVTSFRLVPPLPQKIIFKTTEDVYARVDPNGNVTLPGGNLDYVPAAEFKELDGLRIPANSTLKFRVPPLTTRSWAQPVATIVDVNVETRSANGLLSSVENLLDRTGLRSRQRTVRFLVIGNYWTPSRSTSVDEALRVYCRDNQGGTRSDFCS